MLPLKRGPISNTVLLLILLFFAVGFSEAETYAQSASAHPPSTDNRDVLRSALDTAYYCKLVADETFIKRRAASDLRSRAERSGCNRTASVQLGNERDKLDCTDFSKRMQLPPNAAIAFERRCAGVKRIINANPEAESFRRPVFEIYLLAYSILTGLSGSELNPVDSEERERFLLLLKDIEFRAELVAVGEDFWGGTLTGSPSIPPIHLAAFASLLQQLETLAKEVRELQWRMEDKQIKDLELTSQAAISEGEVRASLPTADKIAVMRKEAEQRMAAATEQLRLLAQRQKAIVSEQEQLSSQVQAMSASLNNMIAKAVGDYLGVPPTFQDVASGKSVESAFKSYVGARAAEIFADKEVMASFGEIGKSMGGYVQRVQEIRREAESYAKQAEDIKKTVLTTKQYVDDFKALVRQPTLSNLQSIGVRVLAHVAPKIAPAEYKKFRDGFCQIIDQEKPLGALLEQARQPGVLSSKIKEAVRNALNQLPNPPNIEEQVTEIVAEVAPARRVTWLADLLDRGAELSVAPEQVDAVKTQLSRVAMELWPRTFINRIPPVHREGLMKSLRQRFGIGSEDELIDRIREVAVPQLFVRNGTVAVSVGAEAYPIGDFEEFRAAVRTVRGFEVDAKELQVRIEQAVHRLVTTTALKDTIAKEILTQIPFSSLERRVDVLRSNAEAKAKVFNAAINRLGEKVGVDCTQSSDGAVEKLIANQVGARMSSELMEVQQHEVAFEQETPELSSAAGGASGGLSPEFQLATAALNAAFPGAGAVANFAASAFINMQETAHLAAKINGLTAESNRLVQIEVQLNATLEATRISLQINQLDGEASEIRRQAALKQYDALTRATQKAGQQGLRGLTMIQRRQPLIFYIAERLRQEYDLLDRSLALWGPSGGTVRDAIRSLVEQDPQNIRLALDSDIHLFQWLDRSDERIRTDIDRVLAHWRQIYRIVTDLCEQVGCLPGKSRLGHVQQTQMMDLCTLMAVSECRRLRDWIRQPAASEGGLPDVFSALITFPLDGKIIPDHFLNVRVIDVRLGAYLKTSKGQSREPLRLDSIQLLHPGVAFIKQPSGYAREAYAPFETATFDWPSAFDLEALGTRWNDGARPSRRVFEGYGLVTTWRVAISRSSTIGLIDVDAPGELGANRVNSSGVFVRFAYSYHLPPPTANIAHEFIAPSDYVPGELLRPVVLRPGKGSPQSRTLEIPESILQLIGNSVEFAAAQNAWLYPDALPKPENTLRCDSVKDSAVRKTFATQVCLMEVNAVERENIVQEETRSFMASCIPEATQLAGRKSTLRRRELNEIIGARYARFYAGARKLVEGNLLGKPAGPVSLCGMQFQDSHQLCEDMRTGRLLKKCG